LLKTVSEALGVMTAGIIERDGAIADFQGDAVLGFWGWPVQHEDGPLPACRAALAIHKAFHEAVNGINPLLRGFSVGIGIAHGKALAGQIGTRRQAKVGVFGPVVNQGSRLEGLTKKFGVPICIDQQTAKLIHPALSKSDGRLRRLARVRPAGMDTALEVHALLPPAELLPEVTDADIEDHDAALTALIDGRWAEAAAALTHLPDKDGPAQFLRAFLAERGLNPPLNWDGVISLNQK
jgi:adenylate cyclase